MWPPSGKVPKIAKKYVRGIKRLPHLPTGTAPSPRFPYCRTTLHPLTSPCPYSCNSLQPMPMLACLCTCHACTTTHVIFATYPCQRMPHTPRSPTPATTSAPPPTQSTHQQGNIGIQALELLLPQGTQPHAMPQILILLVFQRFRLDYN